MNAIENALGISIIDLISFVASIVTIFVIYAIYQAALVKDPMKGRVKALQDRREALKAGLVTTKKRNTPIKKTDGVNTLRTFADKLKLLQKEQTEKASKILVQAGFRSNDALVIYQVARLSLPLLMGILGIIMFYGLGVMPGYADFHGLMAGGMVLLGLKLPDIYVANVKTKRVDALRKSLPDALDLLVVCAEAGLTLDSALNRVAKEIGGASPELADELALTAIELGFLPERRQALINLSERVDLASLRGVVTTLIQSEKYGTPLATSLRVLSAEFRNERLMRAEEKAARLPAILTVPLIVFIMPALFVVLMGPAACKVSQDFINQ
ncbi:type II secretion system F family protein [Kordiimonas sp. SCSIO 12610]|uniref:type II secretion system F family protein n=1 Tax=Kordiimonas sp. SCSIO 12610 TaxID=2829597 RepID=UPI00210C0EB7|nr:type II secretion system F family protein [Kordiimonas sp. SCSIO 12610]UTW56002.1 type II secretion system F family protein [Kordiimonas sp. SCSIO 12610]